MDKFQTVAQAMIDAADVALAGELSAEDRAEWEALKAQAQTMLSEA